MNKRQQAERIYRISRSLETLAEKNHASAKEVGMALDKFDEELNTVEFGNDTLILIIARYDKIKDNLYEKYREVEYE